MTNADDTWVCVKDLRPGDMVDLEGDQYADPQHDDPAYECEYALVAEIQQETPMCICVYFEGGDSVGFPPCHTLKYGGHDPSYSA